MHKKAPLQSIFDQLEARVPKLKVVYALIAINVLVFIAMLTQGAGFWHPTNQIQLAWGANFAPATQDGEWWRLGSAMFLHFSVIHLLLNSYALWDVGQLAERAFTKWRLLGIYIVAGLFGNVLSLVLQGNQAVSGGASGAVFGLYAAVLVFLWRERDYIAPKEFKQLFGVGVAFSMGTIILGFIIPGIDNAAHIGGFVAGALASIIFAKPMNARKIPIRISVMASALIAIATTALLINLPEPKYKMSDEVLVRAVIGEFMAENQAIRQAINRQKLNFPYAGKDSDYSFSELADQIDQDITKPYEDSFEKLSKLPYDPDLPSAKALDFWLDYTQRNKSNFENFAQELRKRDSAEAAPD